MKNCLMCYLMFVASAAWAAPQAPLPAACDVALAPLPVPSFAYLDALRAEAAPFATAAREDQLREARGGTDTAPAALLGGTVSSNSATNVATGANTITAGSFANMSGLPVVIQNTGANVLIQNATVINLQLR